MAKSHIEWTESTWNPVTGCTKVSEGCRHCYAELFARRLQGMGVEKYRDGFRLACHPDALQEPFRWKKPRVVFVNSMSDLFHKDIPLDYIQKVYSVMRQNPHHVFQVLTKRADVLRYYDSEGLLNWPHNVWMGVTVENADHVGRIELLRQTRAKVKFLSCEPLLSALPDLNLDGIDWVIVGGESGRGARQMKEEWVLDIREKCLTANVPFFFKQWGGINKKAAGRLLEGKVYDGSPMELVGGERFFVGRS
jgi:protein gp37